MSKFMSPTEDALEESPSQDKSERCSLDRLIRSLGYEVADRPRTGEAVWIKKVQGKDGRWIEIRFPQSEVLRREKLE